jgi:hypothetical protein
MGRVVLNNAGLDGVGEDAAEKTNSARGRSNAAANDGFSAQLLGLDRTRVFPAMMSLRTLLMSVLVRSLTRRVPMSGTM